MNSKVICVIMGGGRGSRLHPLTKMRCKPAVPLAGKYRLVDIPISNCLNSGMNRIFVLTQFNTASLHRHIQDSYKFDPFGGGFVDILSAEQTEQGDNWYQGTADAVRQNLHHFEWSEGDVFLILSGDQLYRMDLHAIVQQHRESKSEVTIAARAMLSSEVSALGVMQVKDNLEIERFVEKPKDPAVIQSLVIPETLKEHMSAPGSGDYCLANMGIYVFNGPALRKALDNNMTDFGKEVIPSLLGKVKMCGYIFDGYWEDIGTVASFFDANLSLADDNPPFDFFQPDSRVFTHARYLPASRVRRTQIDRAIVADGCDIVGATLKRCVIGVRAMISDRSELENVVMMGSDYFETDEQRRENEEKGLPALGVGPGCHIRQAIIDKNARIGAGVKLVPSNHPDKYETLNGQVFYRDGVIVVNKDAVVPEGFIF